MKKGGRVKILLVHNHYRSLHIGGEDKVFQTETSALKNALGLQNVLTYECFNEKASFAHIFLGLIFPFHHMFSFWRTLKKHEINIVHVHNEFPLISPWIFLVARLTNTALVQTLHNYRHWCVAGTFYVKGQGVCRRCPSQKSFWPGVKQKCYRNSALASFAAGVSVFLAKLFRLYQLPNAYFYLSEHQHQTLLELGIPQQQLIYKPNFVLPTELGIENRKEIDLLFVGRIDEEKGIFYLLDNLTPELRRRLAIIGTCDNIEHIKARYPEVDFLGKRTGTETIKFISKAKFLVQPSLLYETFGLTILESFSVGTPVIGFPIGTRNDFINDGENGFLISLSPQEMNQKIEKALNFERYEMLQLAAKQSYSALSMEKTLALQISIYQKLTDDSRNKNSAFKAVE